MSNLPILLPAPRQMAAGDGNLALRQQGLIVLDAPDVGVCSSAPDACRRRWRAEAGVAWEIVAGNAVPHDQVGATLSVVGGGTRHPRATS